MSERSLAAPLGDESEESSVGIDYSEIPDMSEDDAFWAAARIGPVSPPAVATRVPSPVTGVRFTAARLYLRLADGREIGAPLAWFPRLADAAPAQRKRWQRTDCGFGVHWPDLGEDVSVHGLLGVPD